MCKEAKVAYEPRLDKLTAAMTTQGLSRVEYGRAGERAGVDVYVEPTEAPPPSGSKTLDLTKAEAADVN
jgi:hypothetical protein